MIGARPALAAAIAAGLMSCRPSRTAAPPRDEAVLFSRAAFEKLAAADPAVAGDIDWAALQGATLDVGSLYRALPDDRERADFRTAFIASFSSRLREQGVVPAGVHGWRVEKKSASTETVAADAPQGELRITVAIHPEGLRIIAIGP